MPKQSSYIPGREEVGKTKYLYGPKDYANIDMWRQPDSRPGVRLHDYVDHLPEPPQDKDVPLTDERK